MNITPEVVPVFCGFPKIPRLSRPCIITEKIDGTNASILVTEDGAVFAASRSRWLSSSSPHEDNYGFARWVETNAALLRDELGVGHHFGEWWGQGIQRRYGKTEKVFSLFNTGHPNYYASTLCRVVPVLYVGVFNSGVVDHVLERLREDGSYAAPGFMNPEGVVVYHTSSKQRFKKTIEKDEEPNGASPN